MLAITSVLLCCVEQFLRDLVVSDCWLHFDRCCCVLWPKLWSVTGHPGVALACSAGQLLGQWHPVCLGAAFTAISCWLEMNNEP